jgi:hypothetical protein
VPRINASHLRVSRLLWLIVALESFAVKSSPRSQLIFRPWTQPLQARNSSGLFQAGHSPRGSSRIRSSRPSRNHDVRRYAHDYDQVVTTPSPQSEPELLSVGFGEAGRLSRRGRLVLIALILVLLVGLGIWRFWPERAPLFSLSDLQGVYAGYDGTNEASVIDRRWTGEQDGYIVPSACGPLFEATVLNRVPQEALDGVGTFWEVNNAGVSLFTYRFADLAGADREFNRLATVLDNCDQARVEVHARPASRGLLTRTPLATDSDPPAQIGYVLTTNSGIKLAVHVLAFSNTVSWQFRYEPVPGSYLPLTAQRVMDSLADQMRAVQDLIR